MQPITVHQDAVASKFYEWGALKWLVDDAETPGSRQSFGLVYIEPGKTNPPIGTRPRGRLSTCSRASATCASTRAP
jgi:hypothetical protein